MADYVLARWLKPPLEVAAARLGAFGLGSLGLIVTGLVVGFAAIPAIATGRFWIGLGSILLSRLAVAVGRMHAGVRALRLGAAFEMIFLASIPFAFALYEPGSALSACLLLFGLVAAGAASLFANADRALATGDIALCVIAFALACLRPDWFALIAYLLSVFSFIAAGARIALAFTRSEA